MFHNIVFISTKINFVFMTYPDNECWKGHFFLIKFAWRMNEEDNHTNTVFLSFLIFKERRVHSQWLQIWFPPNPSTLHTPSLRKIRFYFFFVTSRRVRPFYLFDMSPSFEVQSNELKTSVRLFEYTAVW